MINQQYFSEPLPHSDYQKNFWLKILLREVNGKYSFRHSSVLYNLQIFYKNYENAP